MTMAKNKVISAFLAGMMLFSATVAPTAIQKFTGSEEICTVSTLKASAADNWRTGCFGRGTSWTTEHKLYVNSGRRNFYVNFYSYYANGRQSTGTTMDVTVYNGNTGSVVHNAKWVRSGGSLQMKGGATWYRIKIRRHSNSGNAGSSAYWATRINQRDGWIS